MQVGPQVHQPLPVPPFPPQIPAPAPASSRPLIEDQLYELLPLADNVNPNFDFVLFHGLQLQEENMADAYEHTWRKRGNATGLPELLRDKYPAARILSVSWKSAAFQNFSQNQNWNGLAAVVHASLTGVDVGSRPTVFIGHSLGGLMMKQVVVELHDRAGVAGSKAKQLSDSLAGLVYLATPQKGSKLADWLQNLTAAGLIARARHGETSVLMDLLVVLNPAAADLQLRYRLATNAMCNQRPRLGSFSYALYETVPVTKAFGMFKGLVVEMSSAVADMDDSCAVGADHSSIACPAGPQKSSWVQLCSHLDIILPCALHL